MEKSYCIHSFFVAAVRKKARGGGSSWTGLEDPNYLILGQETQLLTEHNLLVKDFLDG